MKIIFFFGKDRQNEDNSTSTPHDDNPVVLKKEKNGIDMLLEADEIQVAKKTLNESRAGEGKGIGNENSKERKASVVDKYNFNCNNQSEFF